MIAELKPYPTNKDSGVPWLGEVPEHWEVQKLRNVLKGLTERNQPDLPLLSVVREKGVILRDMTNKDENHNFIPDDLSNYKVVRSGQFAMNKMKAWQGSYGISRFDGIVSPAYFIFDIAEVEGAYFHSAIRSKAYVPFFAHASDGVRIGQWDLAQARMKEIPFFIPPLFEQSAIVRFLDHIDRRIKHYISAKQKLVKLLEEQKQAIIHRAVTRGLDPNVHLKPSGVEWLGDVPEHWQVLPGMVALREKQYKNTGLIESRVLSLSYGQIIVKPFEKLHGLVPESFETYQIVNPGEIIIRPTDLQNDQKSLRVGLVRDRGIITSAYLCLLPLPPLSAEYAYQLFNAYDVRKVFYKLGSGTRQNLKFADIKRLPVLAPPAIEQADITAFIQAKTAAMATAIDHARSEISLLREYRTRLIADVVTGKVDVREAAVRLPEETEEPKPLDEADVLNDAEEVADDDLETAAEEVEA